MAGEVIQRGSRGRVEAQRDREMLGWIARFRFVTAEVLSARFEISTQSINARLRRLEDAGLITMHRSEPTQPRAVFITGRGARQLGLRVRRPPRPDAHRAHELAIARLAAQLEKNQPEHRVLTEREQRAHELNTTQRYSIDLRPPKAGEMRRWPDLVIESDGHRTAIEIEFATKAPERLRRIVAGWAAAPQYDEVRFLVTSLPLALRIANLAHNATRPSALADMLNLHRPRISVIPWPSAPDAERERIAAALAQLRVTQSRGV